MTPPVKHEGQKLPVSKRILFYGIAIGLLLGSILLMEGLVRLVAPGLRNSYHARIDPETGIGYTGGHPYSYNKWRLMEREFPAAAPAGETRILALGDSITQGYGLARESAWPKVVQRQLQAQYPGKNYFCINGAGSGSTTHRQSEFFANTGKHFEAELIIVGFCMNDVRLKSILSDVQVTSPPAGNDAPSQGKERKGAGRFTKSLEWRQKLRASYLFAAIDLLSTEVIKRYIVPMSGQSWIYAYPYQMNAFGHMPDSDKAWEDTAQTLLELNRGVQQSGARMALAAFPYQFQVSENRRDNPYGVDKTEFTVDPIEKLRQIAAQGDFTFIDLSVPFSRTRSRMLAGEEPWDPLFIDFCHPNERGQTLAADFIFRQLRKERLLN